LHESWPEMKSKNADGNSPLVLVALFALAAFVAGVFLVGAQRPDWAAVECSVAAVGMVVSGVLWLFGRWHGLFAPWLSLLLGAVSGPGMLYLVFANILIWSGSSPFGGPVGQAIQSNTTVTLTGIIDHAMYDQWRSITTSGALQGNTRVALDSRGGDIRIAHTIVEEINGLGYPVEVKSGNKCESACTSIFALAKTRFADPEAKFMFHGSASAVGIPFVMFGTRFDPDAPSTRDDVAKFDAVARFLEKEGAFDSTRRVELKGQDLYDLDHDFLQLR
jgi:hypothetical protein